MNQRAAMYKRILVAYDGSPGARDALLSALALARGFGSEVCALSVEGKLPRYAATVGEIEEVDRERREYFEQLQAEAQRIAQDQGLSLRTFVAPGPPAETIVKYARDGKYSLIVMGHKGHSRLHNYLIGATTDRVTHLAPCSVLIVREEH
jgi:nucleotide-binding universal stress UspA family protein